jgi:hypothetical protein
MANATADQIDFVAEVIVQHAMGKLGLLRDFAQAGPRIAKLGQSFQRGLGKLDSSRTEFVDTRTLNSIRGPARPLRRFNFPLRRPSHFPHANSESSRHLGRNNALRPLQNHPPLSWSRIT